MKSPIYGRNKQTGFTIIEVVIVLAIAALILMAVFLAIPSARQAVRNHARRQHAAQFLGALEESRAQYNGQYPVNMNSPRLDWYKINDSFIANNSYISSDNFVDPLGKPYTINYGPSISGLGHIDWFVGASCSNGIFKPGAGFRGVEQTSNLKVAVVIGLEPGDYEDDNHLGYWLPESGFSDRPEDTTYCVDNS